MPATATIVNKGIQVILSREEAINLAHTGNAVIIVKDAARQPFGEVRMRISPLVQAAILEHVDLPVPSAIMNAANLERGLPIKGGK